MRDHQRQFTRHAVALKVEVRTKEGWTACETVDLSRNGVFVRSEVKFEVQRVIQLRLHVPGSAPIALLAQIRRVSPERGSQPPGIGVEFFPMPPPAQRVWDAFVSSISEDELQAMAEQVPSDDLPPRAGRDQSSPGHARPRGLTPNPARSRGVPATGADAGLSRGPRRRSSPRQEAGFSENEREPSFSGVQSASDLRHDRVTNSPWGRSGGPKLPPSSQRNRHRREPEPRALEPERRTDLDAVVIRVRPSTGERLKRLMKQCLEQVPLTMRSKERTLTGQAVALVLVHHDTDAEFAIDAHCTKAMPSGRSNQQTLTLRFAVLDEERRDALRQFVQTGSDGTQSGAQRRQQELLQRCARRVEDAPGDAQALVDYGWAILAVDRDPEGAIDIFLQALAVEDTRPDVHRGLSVCYALTDREEIAYTFVSNSLTHMKQTPDKGRSGRGKNLLRDDIGFRR
ncbi:MAG: PilZ domain-containing protein [Myxococcales bacterium]|nr:PilZ domain-containing protein [Myxococcales bacterium]